MNGRRTVRKKIASKIVGLLISAAIFSGLVFFCGNKAEAGSLDNAYEFSISYLNSKVIVSDNYFYLGTSAKIGTSGTRYRTIGWSITSNAGHYIECAVGGSITHISQATVGGYQYDLYRIPMAEVIRQMQSKWPDAGNVSWLNGVLRGTTSSHFTFNAIMTKVNYGTAQGTMGDSANGYAYYSGSVCRTQNDIAAYMDLPAAVFIGYFNLGVDIPASQLPTIDNTGIWMDQRECTYSVGNRTYWVRTKAGIALNFDSIASYSSDYYQPNFASFNVLNENGSSVLEHIDLETGQGAYASSGMESLQTYYDIADGIVPTAAWQRREGNTSVLKTRIECYIPYNDWTMHVFPHSRVYGNGALNGLADYWISAECAGYDWNKSITLKSDGTPPAGTQTEIKNANPTGYDVYIYGVSDSQSGVKSVLVPTWTAANGQDDIRWYTAANLGNGTWYYHVTASGHSNEGGRYISHVYAYDNVNNVQCIGAAETTIDQIPPVISGERNIGWTRKAALSLSATDEGGSGLKGIVLSTDNYMEIVEGLYRYGLNRTASQDEILYWLTKAVEEDLSREILVRQVVSSPEFTGRNYSNQEYIEILYRAVLGRAPDGAGLKYHTDKLNASKDRAAALKEFTESQEFRKRISQTKAASGYSQVDYSILTEGITFYQAIAEDNAGNTASKYALVKLDVTAPDGDATAAYTGSVLELNVKNVIEKHSGVQKVWAEIIDKADVEISMTKELDATGTDSYAASVTSPDLAGYNGIHVIIKASDKAGNVGVLLEKDIYLLGVTATVARVLSPHEPCFAGGEKGILRIATTGFAEKVIVTFPASITALDASLDREIILTPKATDSMEYEFFVPVMAQDGAYEITVTAYKGSLTDTSEPSFTVAGSILDKLRTRIRTH
ncbi:GBS Bsp-like repeat-containing protein [Anaerobium acetethylicum]|uniref:DUF4214 domain-containing protein n=1 Tax=Anaerobium acetethylicum TaxID=1619234 RepID=A0A1D3TXI7_9FIRM|nr:GBS Bsp-like repeat-containing protein [Anaerobium acetethylicum]SCP99057.1 protein of unknown function [Anaerobium acetethylicum]